MNVDIYMPRLDVSFKKGPTPKERGEIPEIRIYWQRFCTMLKETYVKAGHSTRLIEAPLWQITETLVKETSLNADIIYIPHKMRLNWHLDDRVFYYMQMVVPNIFSIDKQGWCASAEVWPILPRYITNESKSYTMLSSRIKDNTSKFVQPSKGNAFLPDKFVFFPCQIPHDETIRFHSDVSVEDSLSALLQSINYVSDFSIVIKGHPANKNSMQSLVKIFHYYKKNLEPELAKKIQWIDECSIHDLLANCRAVFTVNSGVGFEALLHDRPVYTFGNADYASASTKIMFGGCLKNATHAISKIMNELANNNHEYNSQITRSFIDSWYQTHYDCEAMQTFAKVPMI